jgi:uncharacterized iron-regulated membrane protein
MQGARLSRKIHKWIALILGIQLLLWALSGFYMVVVNIDIIHGDMLVKNMTRNIDTDISLVLSMDQVVQRHPDARNVTLKTLINKPVYLVEGAGESMLLDANTGEQLSPLDEETALQIARDHYAGEAEISRVESIVSDPPGEIRFMPLPVWRVDFDDAWGSSFYIDPRSGRFSSRRHSLWRVFDFLWMLHIMDYDEREVVNTTQLRVFSIVGVVLGISGVWLLFYSFRRRGDEGDAL